MLLGFGRAQSEANEEFNTSPISVQRRGWTFPLAAPVSLPQDDPRLGLVLWVISVGGDMFARTYQCQHPVQRGSNLLYPRQQTVQSLSIPMSGWLPDRQI